MKGTINMNSLSSFEAWALNNNLIIEHCNKKKDVLNNEVLMAFKNIEYETCFLDFLNYFSKVESEDQKVWFWCLNDYKYSSNSNEFTWNEFEKISKSYAMNETERNKINEWWLCHLPISISLRDGYSYLAIDLIGNVGSVVVGYEPIFEDATTIADSFEELLGQIISGNLKWF